MQLTLHAYSALTGLPINSYPISQQTEITDAVAIARQASLQWASLSVAQRVKHLAKLEAVILRELDTITDMLVLSTGKVKTEVILGEIYPVLDLLRYYQKNAVKILAHRPVMTSPLAYISANASYERRPFGTVAVISPWNFPFQLTINPLLTALIAGNGCVFKMSELSLPVGELILDLLIELELPTGLVQAVRGEAETGKQLISVRPDLVFFTGSVAGGRAVMEQAAQHPIPVILELGGKDAMLVFADAPIKRAVNAAMYGAFSNSGQVCASIERCYVEANIYTHFVNQLCEAVQALKIGHGETGDLGCLTTLKQFAIIEAHYNDAIAKGAKTSAPLRLEGGYLYPLVLWDVTPTMLVMQEETFGPLLPVMAFESEQQAVELANVCDFGLNASVWSGDIAKAERVARQLQVGNWVVNDVLKNIGHSGLPFGGVKNSGFGRYHGAEGLRQFTYTVSGLTSRSKLNDEPNWFPYSESRYQAMCGFIDFRFGGGNIFQRIIRNLPALRYFQKYSSLNLRQHCRNLWILLFKKNL